MTTPDLTGVPATVLMALAFLASSATPEEADRHEQIARKRGATDDQITYARRLNADQLAGCVQTIEGAL